MLARAGSSPVPSTNISVQVNRVDFMNTENNAAQGEEMEVAESTAENTESTTGENASEETTEEESEDDSEDDGEEESEDDE